MDARMNHVHRFLLSFFLSGVLVLCAAMCWATPANSAPEFGDSPQQGQGTLPPGARLQIPPMPKVVDPYAIDKKALLEANRKELRSDVERLLTLAQSLNDQSNKTDSAQTLSVDFVKNAKEIEKLSKKIQKLARN
ncbi:MAG: hypothetical protein ACRD4V_07500 [Candidatus Acidiferrales bacterium]